MFLGIINGTSQESQMPKGNLEDSQTLDSKLDAAKKHFEKIVRECDDFAANLSKIENTISTAKRVVWDGRDFFTSAEKEEREQALSESIKIQADKAQELVKLRQLKRDAQSRLRSLDVLGADLKNLMGLKLQADKLRHNALMALNEAEEKEERWKHGLKGIESQLDEINKGIEA